MATRPSILACMWLAVAAATTAQDSPPSNPQQPTFRTGTQSVRVDLYVTRDGKPVADLRRDEVQVFEDGVPQSIQAFERITFAAPKSAPVVEPRTLQESRRLATDPRSRLFVVFLTTPEAPAPGGPRVPRPNPTLGMLNDLLGPDDVVAVMTPYMRIEEMTFRRRLPQNDDVWFRELTRDPKQQLWEACYPPGGGSPINEMKSRYRELMAFEALEALITHLGGLRDERKHILVMSDGFRLYTRNPALPGRGEQSGGGLPIGGGGGGIGVAPRLGDSTGAPAGRTPHECRQDLQDLASLDHSNRLDEIATYAQRTNVSFYPISPQRVTSNVRGLRFRGSFENNTTSLLQSSLRGLAEDTGGIPIISTNNVQGLLNQITTTTSSYYLIGYTPANTAADGQFRRISVKVSRPDTDVHARSGYVVGLTEERSVAPVETRKAPDPVDISLKALTVLQTSVVHLRSAAWTRGTGSGAPAAALWIIGELDAQLRRQAAWSNGGTAEVSLRPMNGGAAISRQANVTVSDSTFEFELREPDGPIAPGDYSLQLTLKGADGNPVGEFARVTVPDAVSRFGEAVLLRRGTANGARYARTADPRFQRTDRLRLELPTDAADTASAVLRDTRGSTLSIPLQISERPDRSGGFRWIVVDVPLTSLAPADYAVQVTQGGASRLTAFRLTP